METSFSFYYLITLWDTLDIRLLSILLYAIMGGIAGFLIILIAQIILRKKILIHRRYKILKYIAYLYLIFFPLFGAFCFSSWFALHNAEKQVVNKIPDYLGVSNELFNTYLKAEVESIIEAEYLELTGKEVIHNTMSFATDVIEEAGLLEENIEQLMIKHLLKSSIVRDIILSKVTSTISSTLFLNDEIVDELLEVQFQNLLDDGILNTICEKYTRSIFGGFKMNLVFLFLLGISLPLFEIILANYLENKNSKRDSSLSEKPLL